MNQRAGRISPGEWRIRLVDLFRGTNALSLSREYLATQWLPAEEVRRRQWTQLTALLEHSYRNVPYYRNLFASIGAAPGDIRTMADFRRLPLLTKEIIRANGDEMLAADLRKFRPVRKSTGGSTYTPLQYCISAASNSAHWAAIYRQWYIGGWHPGDRLAYFGGSSMYPSLHALERSAYIRLNNWVLFSSFQINEENMRRWLGLLARGNVRFIHGYPACIHQLASYASKIGTNIRLSAVFGASEPLFPHSREAIARAFSCQVFDFYGANDGGGFAFECEAHAGLHPVAEKAIMEFVDEQGKEAAEGEDGEIITTDLLNYSMPFIRYRVGDVATVGPPECPCGRGMPLIRRIQGRLQDFITTPQGEKIHGGLFAILLGGIPWVEQFQVIQEAPDRLTVYIRPVGEVQDGALRRITRILERKFQPMTLSVELTGRLIEAPGGKFRNIINRTVHS